MVYIQVNCRDSKNDTEIQKDSLPSWLTHGDWWQGSHSSYVSEGTALESMESALTSS